MRRYCDIVLEILIKELRVRYKHLALGYVWSIASPLAYAFLYYVVFALILKVKTPNFPAFLIVGLFPWQWIANSIGVGPMTFFGNAPLIKKTTFPRFIIPLVAVLQDVIHFLMALPVVVAFLLFYKQPLHWRLMYEVPILVVLQFGMTYALNLVIATLNLFFRDLERLLQLAMTVLFYMTPVLYSADMIPQEYRHLIVWQPFATLILNWRNIFLGEGLDMTLLLSSVLWTVGLTLVCQGIYQRLQWRFAEIL